MVLFENEAIWDKVKAKGEVIEKGKMRYGEEDVANKLTYADVTTIIGTLDFFQVNAYLQKQVHFDLWGAKFRVFDWLCMLNSGRNIGYPREDEVDRIRAVILTKVFSDIYLLPPLEKVGQFIEFLREWDLQIVIESNLQVKTIPVVLEGKDYIKLEFGNYELPNLWGDPEKTEMIEITPQDWIFNATGYLGVLKRKGE